LLILSSAMIVSAAVIAAAFRIASAIQARRADEAKNRILHLLTLFGPAAGAAASDPRAVLAWQPLARTARQIFPEEFARLDTAAGGTFPYTDERLQAAHAQWTTDWLGWERTHDSEYKLKAAVVEQEISASGGSTVLRARLDAVEREKLELYQRRYAEYVRVAKALQALAK
jgi:hypothetical protein